MENNNDKSKTVEFRPIKEKKQQVNRKENDVYSNARKSKVYEEAEETQNKSLIILAIVLAVLLIVAIIAGVIILGRGNNGLEEKLPTEDIIDIEEEIPEEEEEKEVITECQIVFYGDSVIKKENGYTILADLYDGEFKKIDNRKLVINSETQIRENGKRLSAEGLIYAVESMAGEGIVFDGKIRESDNVVLKLSYEGSFREEAEEAPPEEEEETTENAPSEEEIPEEENPPAEEPHNNTTPTEGIVDGI